MGKENRRRELLEETEKLVDIITDCRKKLNSEMETQVRKAITGIVEDVKIDFKEFFEKIDLLQGEADALDYQNIFHVLWNRNAPIVLLKTIEELSKERKSPSIEMLYEYVKGMGVKIKAVMSGICVSAVIEVDCKKCYFNLICPLMAR